MGRKVRLYFVIWQNIIILTVKCKNIVFCLLLKKVKGKKIKAVFSIINKEDENFKPKIKYHRE